MVAQNPAIPNDYDHQATTEYEFGSPEGGRQAKANSIVSAVRTRHERKSAMQGPYKNQ